MLKQKAVYWAPTGFDASGKPEYGSPVEINCRWEDVAKEFIGTDGTTQISRSIVYTDRDVLLGGVLLQGELDSGSDVNDGTEIKGFDKIPNLRVTEYARMAYL